MIISEQMLIPFIIANVFALIFVYICAKWPKIARGIIGFGFLAAAIVNIVTAINNPGAYMSYSGSALLKMYEDFINGWFSHHIILFIFLIAIGQLGIAIFSSIGTGKIRKLGLFGGMVFLIAISALGVNSAFPATAVMAIGFAVLYAKEN